MENPFFHLSLEELESGYLRWRSKRQLFWSGIAARPALKNGATKLPWITTRVLSGPTHRFKRRRKPQCTDGVEHSPETHPGWLTDEGTHSLDDNSEDSEVPKTGRLEAARGQPLSLHVGPTVLMLSHGYRFLAAFAETLAATAAQCMVSHPLHLAYMEHAKDARDRLAHIPRERGEGFEEVRGIRVERPARRTHHVTGQRVRLRCFRPCTPDERLELYRRVYGVDCQIPSGDRPPAGPKPPSRSHTPSNGHQIGPILPISGTYVLYSRDNLAMGQHFSGRGPIIGTVTGKAKAASLWEYRVSGFRRPQNEPDAASVPLEEIAHEYAG